ncbi:MAG: M48 family metalloprotease [Deltaproteobacteria bacterium]|nr:M48 family metalloprotease [Deltaproteobacteria bacterium]
MNRPTRRFRAAVLLVGCAANLLSTAALATSYEAERDLGRKFALQAQAQLPLLTDVDVVSYINRMGQRIVAKLDGNPFDYRFFVVRDPKINAFAVPGGYIYFHSGLLVRAVTDDEVAGVMSHEIAHVHAHHLARQQEATKFMNYAALLGLVLSMVQPAIGAGAMAASAAAQLKYRREFEQEADYLGAGYMQTGGYDSQGMLDFFKTMADEQRITPTFAPPYLLSHPLTDERLNHLEAVLRTQQWSTRPRRPASAALARVQAVVRARTETATAATTFYRRYVDDHPSDAQGRYLLGLTLLETGAFDPARQTLEQAAGMGYAAADRELGRTWLRLRQPDKARDLLRRAVDSDAGDPLAHAELAKALETLGDTTGALREYDRAVELAPTLEDAQYSLAMLAGRAGREADGYFHLAEALRLRGEYDKALIQYEKAQPLLSPSSERAAYVRSQIGELKEFLRDSGRRR